MVGTTKQERIDKLALLYDPNVLARAYDEYGHETNIKRNVKTRAMTYEIRTALEYWFDGQCNHRCSRAVWRRLRVHDEDGVPPEECERL